MQSALLDGLHQRARGTLDLTWKRRGERTVLDDLRQEGCLKARFPRPERDAWAGAVLLNTAGGVAGGDRLNLRLGAGPGTAVTVATQAAERFYRAVPGQVAAVTTTLNVAAGAAFEWLPQESILFDRAALRRRLLIDIAEDAVFTGIEQLVFGRTAMGEHVASLQLRDLIAIRRGGRALLHDAIRIDGSAQSMLDRPATGAGARAVATLLHVAADAERHVGALRAALTPVHAGVSAWDGMVVARVVAEDGACLRRAVMAGLNVLRAGRPLPRVWEC